MTSKLVYNGQLHTTATHLGSGTVIETDAPVDNQGKGEKFSPTDLVATSLGSCMLTTMGIAAGSRGIVLDDTKLSIEKVMAFGPRRIIAIKVHVEFPENHGISKKDQEFLEHTALNCPVAKSLHPDITQAVEFNWP